MTAGVQGDGALPTRRRHPRLRRVTREWTPNVRANRPAEASAV